MAALSLAFDVLARDKASGPLSKVDSSIDKTAGKVGKFGGKLDGLSGKAKAAMAGGATAVVAFAGSSIKAFVDAEKSQSQLEAAFEKFPALAGGNIDALRKLNSQLATKTKYDDDATASGQAVLAGFGLTADQIAKATPLLQDYATKAGKDLPSAAKDLGKAILGQGKALKGVGINFKDTGSKAGNFDELMGGLSDKVGGFAKKEGKTAAGQAEILKNQFGELQEKVGSKLVPVLQKLTEKLLDFGDWLSKHKPVLVALVTVIGVGLVSAFVAWAASAAAAAVATIAAAAPIIAIGVAIAALVAGVIWAYKNWGFFHDAVDKVASFIKNTLIPVIGNVIGWIGDHLIPIFGKIADKVGEVIGFISDHWQTILAILTGPIGLAVKVIHDHWTGITEFFKGIPGAIAGFFSGLADVITAPFKAAFNAVAKFWNATVGKLSFKVPWWVPGFGGKGWDVPDIPLIKDSSGAQKTVPPTRIVAHSGGTLTRFGLEPLRSDEVMVKARFGEKIFPAGMQPAAAGGPLIGSVTLVQYPGEDQVGALGRYLGHHQRVMSVAGRG